MLTLGLSEIKRIEEKVYNSSEFISLSQGALKIDGVPELIREEVRKLLTTTRADYYQSAWGIPALRSALASYLNKLHGTNLGSQHIIATHGSIGALSVLFLSILEAGDDVMILEPTYPAYINLAKVCRANPVFVSCDASTTQEPAWSFDLLILKKLKRLKQQKVKFLFSPTLVIQQGLLQARNFWKNLLRGVNLKRFSSSLMKCMTTISLMIRLIQ
jgi:aspartate/methionine/tyrosine aminotransferase